MLITWIECTPYIKCLTIDYKYVDTSDDTLSVRHTSDVAATGSSALYVCLCFVAGCPSWRTPELHLCQ